MGRSFNQVEKVGHNRAPVIACTYQGQGLLGQPIDKIGLAQDAEHGMGERFRRIRNEQVPFMFGLESFRTLAGGDDRGAQSHGLQDLEACSATDL